MAVEVTDSAPQVGSEMPVAEPTDASVAADPQHDNPIIKPTENDVLPDLETSAANIVTVPDDVQEVGKEHSADVMPGEAEVPDQLEPADDVQPSSTTVEQSVDSGETPEPELVSSSDNVVSPPVETLSTGELEAVAVTEEDQDTTNHDTTAELANVEELPVPDAVAKPAGDSLTVESATEIDT